MKADRDASLVMDALMMAVWRCDVFDYIERFTARSMPIMTATTHL